MLTEKQVKELEKACTELLKLDKVRHVGVINKLGQRVAGGFKKGVKPLVNEKQLRMVYMQMRLDFEMRKELDKILGPIDYIASRRTNQLIISVPDRDDIVLISAEPDADDKVIIKKAEELFDDIHIKTVK